MNKTNINTRSYWEGKWGKRGKRAWVSKKPLYQWLSIFAPRFMLTFKPRKRYYLGVAKLGEGKFCDLGCGSGAAGGMYSVLSGNQSFGMDYSLEGIRIGREEARRVSASCRFLVGDVSHVGIKSDYFDTVYLGQVLEHLSDDRAALAEAIRIVKPSGKLIISVPTEHMPDNPEHINIYTADKLEKMLSDFGIAEIIFHDIDKNRYVVSGRKASL